MSVITNYATLQTAVADYLARDDLSTFIPNFIQNAENKIYRRLNIRAEETSLSISVANGVGTVPSRFKGIKFCYVNEAPVTVLQWVPIDQLYRDYPVRSGSNTPVVIARDGSSFTFGPYAKNFTLSGIYYQKLQPLRTTDSSWYVVNAPEVLLYGSLLEAESFIQNDPRIPVWKLALTDAIQSIKEEQDLSEYSHGPLRVISEPRKT